MWCWCGVVVCSFGGVFHRVHWCRCAGFLSVLYWLVSSGGALHAFCPLYCIALCRVACEYGSISRFKGVFRGFWGANVCLYGFGVLRGLWGFCARVELGGLEACGVFASILSSFVLFLVLYFVLYLVLLLLCLPFFLPLCSCFLCLSSCPLLVLSLFVGRCFFFPFGLCAKKKGRSVLVRPLLSCCGLWVCYAKYGFPFS